MQFCVFVPTVGGESANLHPDSRKPRATNPKSANVSRTDTEDYIQSSAITRRPGPRFRESYIKLQTYIGGGRRRGQPANALFFCQSRKEECNVHSRNLGPVALRRSPLNIIAPGLRFTQVLLGYRNVYSCMFDSIPALHCLFPSRLWTVQFRTWQNLA